MTTLVKRAVNNREVIKKCKSQTICLEMIKLSFVSSESEKQAPLSRLSVKARSPSDFKDPILGSENRTQPF